MSKNKLNQSAETKLSALVAKKLNPQEQSNKTGFVKDAKYASKIKTFRLRPSDIDNLKNIVDAVNQENNRKTYNESEVLRGIINYISSMSQLKKVTEFIKTSS